MSATAIEEPEGKGCELCGDGPCPIRAIAESIIAEYQQPSPPPQVISLSGEGIQSSEAVHTGDQ